jgi:serine/threonine protein kinase
MYRRAVAGPFGRYEVLHELGRGGTGIVYKAHDPDLHRDVALKVLTPELAVDPRAVERVLREARAQARIARERVVPIYDVGQDAGGPYIVMQYLEGRPSEPLHHSR